MKRIITSLVILLLPFASIQAKPAINLSLLDVSWQPFLAGKTNLSVPEHAENNFKATEQKVAPWLKLSIEHDIKALPNVGLQTNIREHKRKANIDKLVVFDSVTYSNGVAMDSQVDLTHRDHLFYYNLLNDAVDVDFGLNIIRFKGRIVMRHDAVHEEFDFRETMPGLYGKVQYDIPESDIYFKATSTYALDEGNTFTKSRLMLGWQAASGFGIELGYQSYEAEWNNYKNTDGQLSFEGLYTGLKFNF